MIEADKILVGWAQGSDPRRIKWARERLVKRHMGLVHSIARRYAGVTAGRHELEDLVQLGVEGLLRGVMKFDLKRDLAFSTYVSHWVRHAVTRHTLPVKPHDMKVLGAAARARRAAPEANEEEIAAMIGVSVKKLLIVDRGAATPASFDAEFKQLHTRDDESGTLKDVIPDSCAIDAEAALEGASAAAAVRRAMVKLDKRSRRVIELRFGFDSGDAAEGLTLAQVGTQLGRAMAGGAGRGSSISRERVRQLEVEALEQLRRMVEEELR